MAKHLKTTSGITKVLNRICKDEWITDNLLKGGVSNTLHVQLNKNISLYEFQRHEPSFDVVHNDVLMTLTLYQNTVEISFSTAFDDQSIDYYDEALSVPRSISEEQFFQSSLIHDYRFLSYDLLRKFITFGDLYRRIVLGEE